MKKLGEKNAANTKAGEGGVRANQRRRRRPFIVIKSNCYHGNKGSTPSLIENLLISLWTIITGRLKVRRVHFCSCVLIETLKCFTLTTNKKKKAKEEVEKVI